MAKCPYCDFNSHAGQRSDEAYAEALLKQLDVALALSAPRPIKTIFFGGGTPSLMPPNLVAAVVERLQQQDRSALAEVTLEANPGAVDEAKFAAFVDAGVTRFSIGVQSFNPKHLAALGRIHNPEEALSAIAAVQRLGVRLNIDLMYGLPKQTLPEAMADLQQALALGLSHISWYQLTLEENTPFYHRPPPVPDDDTLAEFADQGRALFGEAGFERYEVSAYGKDGERCLHNLNYWQFGDYLGVGAGAHGKLSAADGVWRYRSRAQPAAFIREIQAGAHWASVEQVAAGELPFEFMLNALRLSEGVSAERFVAHTGLSLSAIEQSMQRGQSKGLLQQWPDRIQTTERGLDFLFDTLELF